MICAAMRHVLQTALCLLLISHWSVRYASSAGSASTSSIYDAIPKNGCQGGVCWNLIVNFPVSDNSYSMHWHPQRRHPHLNDSSTSLWVPGSGPGPEQPSTGSGVQLGRTRPIRIVVLAPLDSTEEYSLLKIMPSILAAARSIEASARSSGGQLYRGWERGAVIDFVDTKCSSAIGPLIAFEYFIRGSVDIFLGPVCPYVLAPVARYTSYWGVPQLTSSGQVTTFDDKNQTFRILTRMNGSFSRMGQFFNQVIIIMCAKKDTVRRIMMTAYRLGMVQTGEYVFINVELTTGLDASQRLWERADDSDRENRIAKEAFTALIRVTPKMPKTTEINSFLEEVSTYVTAFYEGLYLYALGLNDTLSQRRNPTGKQITESMWGRTFTGIAGDVTIDPNGDRLVDYTLFDMDPSTGVFEPVMQFDSLREKFFEVEGKRIHWANDRDAPPPDTPPCGFEGELCPEFEQFGGHYRLEAELASMTWKIRPEDILSPNLIHSGRFGSKISLARTSISSDTIPLMNCKAAQGVGGQIFGRTGIYRSLIVAIKPLERSKVELTRSLLIDLKNMKNLQHNHIATFIGACLDSPNGCFLVYEYCPKGSLQDILENDEIKLDSMFRNSLMHDICKGMSYLHSSEMQFHGNLKSSNCVVDSRFVLKITDFGIRSFKSSELSSGAVSPNDMDDTHYAFWKGDVYSFAIIAHEIVLRKGPFWIDDQCELSSKEIIHQVCDKGLRPSLEEDGIELAESAIVSMIQRCWNEDTNERPDLENESSNILDNLLKRMELYANNLETLVQERTDQYLEEKRHAEDLLYQLLPKSVASQLIRGETVRAEAYDSVTIYFSDIVGFTKLSAQSTPMQVVTVLNDLYTCFDSTIENFDVYKVETIGDAYMVVSGLPVRNGDRHGAEIARMALTLLHAVRSFTIRHRPEERLMLRIGIHSGSCVAGIVGHKMPRYCLFGDTVNTASRMESTGSGLSIV
ncbi:hypothetical protein RI129_000077 [Pyrocoelia pectoralis]|uniref:Guanylate cyclase n=1 Tax=Pyrocoelia pectoralis TaxID=417401 RepID=A0AAN7URW1_9COLE